MSTLLHLDCTMCGKTFDANQLIKLCDCGKVLYPRYNIEKAKETLTEESLGKRRNDIWRMEEIMPCSKPFQFSLGEGGTPLLSLADDNYNFEILIKEEGLNPTGSFKSRGLCAAVSRGYELGARDFVIPTAGNAGAALSAYCARTGSKAHIFTPKDVPQMILKEMKAFGAEITLVDGLITDAGALAKEEAMKNNWFDVSTLKEPYRVEGKKTMGLEIAEQLNWNLPDVIIYPTGGGTGIVGMHKAFEELEQLGLIGPERPRMVSVQSSGCAPIVRAYQNGDEYAETWDNAQTDAPGLRVPAAIGDYLILRAIRETDGTAVMVSDESIMSGMKEVAKKYGLFMSPEASATYEAMKKLSNDGWIENGNKVVLFSTATGFTTPNLWG